MKFTTGILITLLLANFAFAQNTSTTLALVATQFGLKNDTKLQGHDKKGRPCAARIFLSNALSVESTAYVTENSVENAYFKAYNNFEILTLETSGSANGSGVFVAKTQEIVAAHKTDFGWSVAGYKVNYYAKLTFENGQLVAADVVKDRPGLSKLVIDSDFSGGSILDCRR